MPATTNDGNSRATGSGTASALSGRALTLGLGALVLALVIDRFRSPGDASTDSPAVARERATAHPPQQPAPAPERPRLTVNPGALRALPWARISTNKATLSLHRLENDLEYRDVVRRHVQLRALMNSPARDTPECIAVGAMAEAYGYPIEVVPMAYRFAWERKAIQQKLAAPENDGERRIRLKMSESDFVMLIRRYQGRKHPEFLDALKALDPKVPFGHLDVSVNDGEPLFEE